MYTWNLIEAYQCDFVQTHILSEIKNSHAWKTPDHELKQYLLIA